MTPNSSPLFPERGRVRLDSIGMPGRVLTIAVSVQAKEFPERFSRAEENDFAMEYTPDPLHPELIPEHVRPFAERDVPVRFHTRFFDFEMGNADPEKAEEAFRAHCAVIDAMPGLGLPVVTVHLNLNKKTPFAPRQAVKNLVRLAERGRKLGITVCLENLRDGPTSNPHNITAWANEAGTMITMDIGHAVSSGYVNEGNSNPQEIASLFSEKLYEAHVYGREEGRHHPVDDMTVTGPIIDRLLETGCNWWTVELDDFAEALDTRKRLLEYLEKKQTT